MTIKVSKPAKGLREAIAEIIGRGASVINGMTKGDAQDELEVSRKNWIINGDMQISQRGDYTSATAASNAVYYLDRWKSYVSGVTATKQDTGNALKYAATSGGAARIGAFQLIEDYANLAGQQITVSAKITSNSSNARLAFWDGVAWTGISSPHSGDGTEETLTVTFTPDASATAGSLYIRLQSATASTVSITSGDYIEFTDVKLEIGDTATPFESRSYAEELRDCQRYYFLLASGDAIAIANGLYYSTTQIDAVVFFPVAMRTTPTLDQASGTNYYAMDVAGGQDLLDDFVLTQASTKACLLYNNTDASGTAGNAGYIHTNNASAKIAFDAEL